MKLDITNDGRIMCAAGELIPTSQIAVLAGVTRGAVSNWVASSTRPFEPVVTLLGHDLYLLPEVEAFLVSRRMKASSTPQSAVHRQGL
jgi:hypothetical protein